MQLDAGANFREEKKLISRTNAPREAMKIPAEI
jgi:hypothetical protein